MQRTFRTSAAGNHAASKRVTGMKTVDGESVQEDAKEVALHMSSVMFLRPSVPLVLEGISRWNQTCI